MKFEVQKSIFLDALQMANSAIPSKSTLQILYNLLLRLNGGVLEIVASDLDLTIAQKLQVEGHQDGQIVLNAKKLLEVVKELPDFPVIIAVDDYVATIKSEGGFQCNLTGFDAAEYPLLPEIEQEQNLELSLKDIKFLTEKTTFAVSTDYTRANLTGVYWEFKDGVTQMVSTDGHKFGKAKIMLPGNTVAAGVILPPKVLNQVLRMADDETQVIQIKIGEANVRFSTDTIDIYTKLIDGPYPSLDAVIPKDFSKKMKANREHLASVIRRVATMSNSKTRMVIFDFKAGQLTLSARNQDLGGDSEESIPVEYTGDAIEVGINANYVLEEFRLIHTEEVWFKFNGPLGAIVIEPVIDQANYFFIVMPLRVLKEAA